MQRRAVGGLVWGAALLLCGCEFFDPDGGEDPAMDPGTGPADGAELCGDAIQVDLRTPEDVAALCAGRAVLDLPCGVGISTTLASLQGLQCLRSVERGLLGLDEGPPTLGSLTGLEGLEEVGGTLDLSALEAVADLDPLARLVRVGGDLDLPTGALTRAALPALREVEGELSLSGSASEFGFDALTRVGDLRVRPLQSEAILIFPALVDAGPVLELIDLGALGWLEFPVLTDTAEIRLDQAPSLISFNAGPGADLEWLEITNAAELDEFWVGSEARLDVLVLEELPVVGYMTEVHMAPGGTAIVRGIGTDELRVLFDGPAGTVVVEGNPNLPDLDSMWGLTYADVLELVGNTALVDVGGLSGLRDVGRLTLDGNGLTELPGFAALENAGTVAIVNHPLLLSIGAFEALAGTASVDIRDNPALRTVDGFNELTGGSFTIRGDSLESTAGFGQVTDASTVQLGGPAWHANTAFPSLVTVNRLILEGGVAPPADLGFPALDAVSSDLWFLDFGAFPSFPGGPDGFAFPSFLIDGGAASSLGSFGVPENLVDGFTIRNTALTNLDALAPLRRAGESFVEHNEALTDLSGLHGLVELGSEVFIRHNPALAEDEVDALRAATGFWGQIESEGNGTDP